jgi:hypothetical protein
MMRFDSKVGRDRWARLDSDDKAAIQSEVARLDLKPLVRAKPGKSGLGSRPLHLTVSMDLTTESDELHGSD